MHKSVNKDWMDRTGLRMHEEVRMCEIMKLTDELEDISDHHSCMHVYKLRRA